MFNLLNFTLRGDNYFDKEIDFLLISYVFVSNPTDNVI